MTKRIVMVFLILASIACLAQTNTTVSSTTLTDKNGDLITGTVQFFPDREFGLSGSGVTCCQKSIDRIATVTAGSFSLSIPNEATINPANSVCWSFIVKDATGKVLLTGADGYNCMRPTGATYVIGSDYVPLTPPVPLSPVAVIPHDCGAGNAVSKLNPDGTVKCIATTGGAVSSVFTQTGAIPNLSGDVTTAGTSATTLASVVSAGSCGDTTHSCGLAIDAKGRITAIVNNVIAAGSGLSGLTSGTIPVATSSTTIGNSHIIDSSNFTVDASGNVVANSLSLPGSGIDCTESSTPSAPAAAKWTQYCLTGLGIGEESSSGVLAYIGAELTNPQTGTSYTILDADRAKALNFSNASTIAITLPQAGSSGFPSGFYFDIQNDGVGTATITPTTSTIGGAATLALITGQGVRVISDGTNYRVTGKGTGSSTVNFMQRPGLRRWYYYAPDCANNSFTAVSIGPQRALAGTGTANCGDANNEDYGVLTTPASSGADAYAQIGATNSGIFRWGRNSVGQTLVNTDSTVTRRLWVGFLSAQGTDSTTVEGSDNPNTVQVAAFHMLVGGTNWFAYLSNGASASTDCDTSVAVNTGSPGTLQFLEVREDSTGFTFWINNTQVCAGMSQANKPTGTSNSVLFMVALRTTAATASILRVGFQYAETH